MDTKKYLIAVVDDDPDDRELFVDAFGELINVSEVLQFENGITFLDYLKNSKNRPPNMVFLDLNMPTMGGMQCLSKLRELVSGSVIPVVILSTSSSSQDIEKAYALGANLYVTKPNNFNDFQKCVQTIIGLVLEEKMGIPSKKTFLYTV